MHAERDALPPVAAMYEATPSLPVGFHDVIEINGRMRQARAVPRLGREACFPEGFSPEGKYPNGASTVCVDGFEFEQFEGAYFLRAWLDIARKAFPGVMWRVAEIGSHEADKRISSVCTVAYGCLDGRVVAAVAEAIP